MAASNGISSSTMTDLRKRNPDIRYFVSFKVDENGEAGEGGIDLLQLDEPVVSN